MRATVCLTLADTDVYAEIDFHCTYKGHPGSGPSLTDPGELPEPPEFGLDDLTLYRDDPERKNKYLECPEWLRDSIFESDAAFEAMCDVWREER